MTNSFHGRTEDKEYPISGMIAEYARLHPAVRKDVIFEYPDLDKEATEEYLSSFFPWFIDKAWRKIWNYYSHNDYC